MEASNKKVYGDLILIKDFIPLFGNKLYMASRHNYLAATKKMRLLYDEEMLQEYLDDIRDNKIKLIVVLLPMDDIRRMYDYNILDVYKENDLDVIHFPIEDYDTPFLDKRFISFIRSITVTLKRSNILIHCSAGHGRTGLVAACVLAYLNIEPKKAINIIRKKRMGTIETKDQEQFVIDFYNNKKILESRYRKIV